MNTIVIDVVNATLNEKSYFILKIVKENMSQYNINGNIVNGLLTIRPDVHSGLDNSLQYFSWYIKTYFSNVEITEDTVDMNGLNHPVYIIQILDTDSIYFKNIEDIDIYNLELADLQSLPYEILTIKLKKEDVAYMCSKVGRSKLTFVLLNLFDTNYILDNYSNYIDWNIISCQTDISPDRLNQYVEYLDLFTLKALQYDFNSINITSGKMKEYDDKMKMIEKKAAEKAIDIKKVDEVLTSTYADRYQYFIDEVNREK